MPQFIGLDIAEVPIEDGVYKDDEGTDPSVVPDGCRVVRPMRFQWGTAMHRPDKIQLYGLCRRDFPERP